MDMSKGVGPMSVEISCQDFKDRFLFEECNEDLPTVRIKRIVIDNFKSVTHGEIVLNCGKQFVPYGTKSDILGVYGQNGSGKTSLIEALSILDRLLNGASVPDIYADCIAVGSDAAQLLFVFELQFENGEVREVSYGFSMAKVPLTQEEIDDRYKDAPADYPIPDEVHRVRIFDEVLRMDRKNTDNKMIMQDIINTSTKSVPFGPSTKLGEFVKKERKTLFALEMAKKTAADNSRSFIFSKKTLEIFKDSGLYSVYLQTILELRYYATLFLYVIDTKSSGLIRLNFSLPLFTRTGLLQLDVRRSNTFTNDALPIVESDIKRVSDVLGQLVPGLSIGFKKIADTLTKSGENASIVMLVANRNGKELPLRDESDGIRKIISILSLLIATYNDQSFTLAVDEFDAGVFEYLLGEILQILEESGKGQFIFTSHNLRPLEVIDKKFLVFTTTNPNNRYYRLKNIGNSNNLRDSYFREIILGEQDEEIYSKTKKYRIVAALRKAGKEEWEENAPDEK